VRASGGKSPAASSHSSKSSAEVAEEVNEELLEEAKRNPSHLKTLVSCFFRLFLLWYQRHALQGLRRDNYRCMVTGKVDIDSHLNGKTTVEDDGVVGSTEAAHILPFSLALHGRTTAEVSSRLLQFWEVRYSPNSRLIKEQQCGRLFSDLGAYL
jgi:hypothetical protein